MRRLLALLLLTPHAHAQTPILLALRANQWSLAGTLAIAENDKLAPKLVDFIRLLTPTQARSFEIARFMADNPVWPDRAMLERRYAEALTAEPDTAEAAKLCGDHAPQSAPALLGCAEAYRILNNPVAAARAARSAWASGAAAGASEQALFIARWPAALTPADEAARFALLEKTDPAAAGRQILRLPPEARPLATARLALRQNDPNALATLQAVPPGQRANPALLLAEARFLRRTHADQAALALWRSSLPASEAATPQAQRAPYWAERDSLARRALADGDDSAAYTLADDPLLAPDQAVEAAFLAGWIALEKLHDPGRARAKFQTLQTISRSAITQARALYWLARATPEAAASRALYLRAAAWPFTYYGQLAARASGMAEADLQARIQAQEDPVPTPTQAAAFAAWEPARAATILAGWGDARRGADFLTQAIQPPASLTTRALAAGLALRIGVADVAVQAARLAGRDGTVLPRAGWPAPFTPPPGPLPTGLALAVMRQESSFDPGVVSPAGARGLMQLMQATAGQIARSLHAQVGNLADPAENMRLGTAYLANLLAQFAPCTPCAIAAYNAGPRRAQEWLAANPQPKPGEATVDWIESIPFAETRNYVQRVLENQTVYAARGS